MIGLTVKTCQNNRACSKGKKNWKKKNYVKVSGGHKYHRSRGFIFHSRQIICFHSGSLKLVSFNRWRILQLRSGKFAECTLSSSFGLNLFLKLLADTGKVPGKSANALMMLKRAVVAILILFRVVIYLFYMIFPYICLYSEPAVNCY